jgi:hypothetical protein
MWRKKKMNENQMAGAQDFIDSANEKAKRKYTKKEGKIYGRPKKAKILAEEEYQGAQGHQE